MFNCPLPILQACETIYYEVLSTRVFSPPFLFVSGRCYVCPARYFCAVLKKVAGVCTGPDRTVALVRNLRPDQTGLTNTKALDQTGPE